MFVYHTATPTVCARPCRGCARRLRVDRPAGRLVLPSRKCRSTRPSSLLASSGWQPHHSSPCLLHGKCQACLTGTMPRKLSKSWSRRSRRALRSASTRLPSSGLRSWRPLLWKSKPNVPMAPPGLPSGRGSRPDRSRRGLRSITVVVGCNLVTYQFARSNTVPVTGFLHKVPCAGRGERREILR